MSIHSLSQSVPCLLQEALHPFQPQASTLGPPRLHLARGLHTLEDTEEHNDPGKQQAEAEVPADVPRAADTLAALDVENVAAVEDEGLSVLWLLCHTSQTCRKAMASKEAITVIISIAVDS